MESKYTKLEGPQPQVRPPPVTTGLKWLWKALRDAYAHKNSAFISSDGDGLAGMYVGIAHRVQPLCEHA